MSDNIFNQPLPPGTKLQFNYSYKGLIKLLLADGIKITDVYTRNLYDVSGEVPQDGSVLVWDSENLKYYPVLTETLIKSYLPHKFIVIRPISETALHLVAFWSADGTFDNVDLSNNIKIIDTVEDNTKVKIYTGTEWITYPVDGTGSPFDSRPNILDLPMDLDPGFIFYWWHDNTIANFQGSATDMQSQYWPI